jgi:hypothetical protein
MWVRTPRRKHRLQSSKSVTKLKKRRSISAGACTRDSLRSFGMSAG